MKTKKSLSVFPRTSTTAYAENGLTKREYFAGLAMQGFISHRGNINSDAIKLSVKYADNLIEELNKPE